MTKIESNKNKFSRESKAMIIFLLLEFLLGIYTAIFLTFPENASKSDLWKFASRDMVLNLHMIIGIIIAFGAISYFIRAIINKEPNHIYSSLVASLGVCLATYGGFMFVPLQNEVYSFIMSIGFVIAIIGYGWGILNTKA